MTAEQMRSQLPQTVVDRAHEVMARAVAQLAAPHRQPHTHTHSQSQSQPAWLRAHRQSSDMHVVRCTRTRGRHTPRGEGRLKRRQSGSGGPSAGPDALGSRMKRGMKRILSQKVYATVPSKRRPPGGGVVNKTPIEAKHTHRPTAPHAPKSAGAARRAHHRAHRPRRPRRWCGHTTSSAPAGGQAARARGR